jgi:6-phosphogluconolactonase
VSSAPCYLIEPSAAALADTVATRLGATLAAALERGPAAHLVLTGGSILEQSMRAVTTQRWRTELDWPRVHVWWGDERFVAAESDERNDKAARAALLDALPLDPARVHRMPSTASGYPDLDSAAAGYTNDLAEATGRTAELPAFDVVLLGMGPDGHCASLFPGHPGTSRTEPAFGVHDSPKPPPERISLSFRALDAAREIWIIASGSAKADAVARAHGVVDAVGVPVSRPRGTDATWWLLDAEAAAGLPAH